MRHSLFFWEKVSSGCRPNQRKKQHGIEEMNTMYDIGSLQYKSDPLFSVYLLLVISIYIYLLFGIADVDRK